MTEEQATQLSRMIELLGGDNIAIRTANALRRNNIHTPDDVLSATHDSLADIRTIGPLGALRLGEMRGSMRPGGRAMASTTGPMCAMHTTCASPADCGSGCRAAADELTRLGQEVGLQ